MGLRWKKEPRVTGWGSGIPHKNTSSEPGLTEIEAKAAAMRYVKDELADQTWELTCTLKIFTSAGTSPVTVIFA